MWQTCPRCRGDGVIDVTPQTIPASPYDDADCPKCQGIGRAYRPEPIPWGALRQQPPDQWSCPGKEGA